MAAPLTDLLSSKRGTAFEWGEVAQGAFERIKEALCSAPVLRLPDFRKEFVIEPDASGNAVGAVLAQEHEGRLLPVAYFSRKYLPAERNYPAGEKELLAIFKAAMKWRCYIDGHPTTVYTDHEPLTRLQTQPYLSKR